MEDILNALDAEKRRIRSEFPLDEIVLVAVEVIRALDYTMFMLRQDVPIARKEWLVEKLKYGWALALSIFYNNDDSENDIRIFAFNEKQRLWIDGAVQRCGLIELSNQFLHHVKAKLMDVDKIDENSYLFKSIIDTPAEYFERLSADHYFQVVNKMLEKRSKAMNTELPGIRQSLTQIVNVFEDKFISYRGTIATDEFYQEFGYLYLMTTQIVDDFGSSDLFGGIQYREYLDLVEDTVTAAIFHRDCCMALAEKTDNKIFLRDTLTYLFSKDAFIERYGLDKGIPREKAEQIIEALTVNRINVAQLLNFPSPNCPPFFELRPNVLMRSSFGSLDTPVQFLNRNLKLLYPKDYFNAVNNREGRFKEQLYSLFSNDIVKINENVIIRIGSQSTDIDAILFDRKNKVLGLFQLKWQDPFSSSMKERYSRISNLIPKSVEWIDKITAWLSANDGHSILTKLRIDDADTIKDVLLFVISRNHVHFSNQSLDSRAIWASWFQILEAITNVKTIMDENPIIAFAAKIKAFEPKMRNNWEGIFSKQDLKYNIAGISICVKDGLGQTEAPQSS